MSVALFKKKFAKITVFLFIEDEAKRKAIFSVYYPILRMVKMPHTNTKKVGPAYLAPNISEIPSILELSC